MVREINESYEATRKRIARFLNNNNISDKEIIVFLTDEIKQYRNKIENLNKTIYNLRERVIESEEAELNVEEDLIAVDEELEQTDTINLYANGKLIETITKYKYKNLEAE